MSVVDIIRFKSLSVCLSRRVELIKETKSKMLINSNSHHVSRPHLKWATFFREQHLPTSPSFRFCLSHTIWFDPLHDPSSASTLKLPQRSGMGWGKTQCLWSTITGSTTKVLKLQSIRDRQMNGRTDIATSFLVHMIPPLRASYSRPQRIIIIIVGVSACPSVCPWKHTPPYDYECALSS